MNLSNDMQVYIQTLRKTATLTALFDHVAQWLCQCNNPLPNHSVYEICCRCRRHYRPHALQRGDKVMGDRGQLYWIESVFDHLHSYVYYVFPITSKNTIPRVTKLILTDDAIRLVARCMYPLGRPSV